MTLEIGTPVIIEATGSMVTTIKDIVGETVEFHNGHLCGGYVSGRWYANINDIRKCKGIEYQHWMSFPAFEDIGYEMRKESYYAIPLGLLKTELGK